MEMCVGVGFEISTTLVFQKWEKIHFCPKKIFKTMKNAIFELKKRHDFWTEIILFFTFQVIVAQTPNPSLLIAVEDKN